jgi:hypothetical protein
VNTRHIAWRLTAGLANLALCLFVPTFVPTLAADQTQSDTPNNDPSAALSRVFSAACRANETDFATYLTADNAEAFRALPAAQRTAFLRRFALADQPGKPLLSSDAQNHTVLRCESSGVTIDFRFGDARTRENLSFIPVTATDGQKTEFGLVRENGGWKLLSLGLVLLDIPELSQQWAAQELTAREDTAMAALNTLSEALQKYLRVFGNLPNTLAKLGPAPKDQISPDLASLVEADLATGKSGGYEFRYRIAPGPDGNDTRFELTATPIDYGKVGFRSFFMDTDGQIHGADKHGTLATSDDPVVAAEKQP